MKIIGIEELVNPSNVFLSKSKGEEKNSLRCEKVAITEPIERL